MKIIIETSNDSPIGDELLSYYEFLRDEAERQANKAYDLKLIEQAGYFSTKKIIYTAIIGLFKDDDYE